ncbi:MAG: mannonate dehydratase [Spirochaetes bacterium]|nr:mannonate dehydratase [Spirochaetota bacterium]
MNLVFRWFGDSDPATLGKIRQIPAMKGIVSALYDFEPGVPWPVAAVAALRERIEAEGLEFRVVESVPVHEDVKLGSSGRDARIEAFIASLRAIGSALGSPAGGPDDGRPPVVTYNFMPAFDWLRTELRSPNPDGSTSLYYDHDRVESVDPLVETLDLPGWLGRRGMDGQARLVARYRELGEAELWRNYEYFLRAVVPAAVRAGVVLAVHPDDPPWPVFGIPRIVTGAQALRRIAGIDPEPANGFCFCAGTFGSSEDNDVVGMAGEFAQRIAFAHLRNVRRTGDRSFAETAHWTGAGSLDMAAIVTALVEGGFDGPVRPDHGRMIWGEEGMPGYGLFDRALGSQYLLGLFEQAERKTPQGSPRRESPQKRGEKSR